MPLVEFFTQFGATYVLRKGADALLPTAQRAATRLYSEKISHWWTWSLAENYLSLTDTNLQLFYRAEQLIEIPMGAQSFVLPATMVCQPEHDGSLNKQDIYFKIDKKLFLIESIIDSYTLPVKKKIEQHGGFFDGRVVRLDNVIPAAGISDSAGIYFRSAM